MFTSQLTFSLILSFITSFSFANSVISPPEVTQRQALQKNSQRIRLSFESLKLETQEQMGLLGGFYDFLPDSGTGFYWGLGGYGAATGDRGGMFTLGMTAGYQTRYKALMLEAGLFVGAGGGASAFPGHGLQIRPHAALGWNFQSNPSQSSKFTPKVEVSWVSFPLAFEGAWKIGVGLDINFDLYSANLAHAFQSKSYPANDDYGLRLSPSIMIYRADKNRKRRSKKDYEPVIGLAGLQIEYFVNNYSFIGFYAYGAGVGGAGGYAKLASVFGLQSPEIYRLSLQTRLLLGMAGGGDIDTDGGLIIQPSIGLSLALTKQLALNSQIGRIYSIDALSSENDGFSATTFELGLSFKSNILTHTPSSSQMKKTNINRVQAATKTWYFEPEILFRNYTLKSDQLDQSGREMDSSIQLFGVGITQPVAYGINLTGRTFWAGWGNVGAYAEGWFGLGYRYPFTDRFFLSTNMALGVSGGGGMPVESGLLSEVSTGIGYTLEHSNTELLKNLTLEFDLALTRATETNFSTITSQIRWVYPVSFYWN